MANLMRWHPVREMATFQDRMDRLFEDFWGREEGESTSLGAWAPLSDLREDEKEFVATVELPGVSDEDVQVQVINNLLQVSGERKFEHEDKRERYHRIERSYGQFQRSWQLPTSVDSSKVTAECRDGVLTVRLPKSEAAQPKQIEVQGS